MGAQKPKDRDVQPKDQKARTKDGEARLKPVPKDDEKRSKTRPKDAEDRPPRPEVRRKGWRQRLTLSTVVASTAVLATLITSSVVGGYAFEQVYRNKLTDTWAILFLDLERRCHLLAERIQRAETPESEGDREAAVLVEATAANSLRRVRGDFPEEMPFRDLGLDTAQLSTNTATIVQAAGKNYLAQPATQPVLSRYFPDLANLVSNHLILRPIPIVYWMKVLMPMPGEASIFIVTKGGRLLFSNDSQVTQLTFGKNPLVQHFITSPMREGQIEYNGDDGPAYGFFYEIPRTNAIMFISTSKSVVLSAVRDLSVKFAFVVITILLLMVVLLQIPLSSLTAPIKDLVRLSGEIGQGNFNFIVRRQGFGELNMLTRSFDKMGKSLVDRERRIQLLLEESKERLRLEKEVVITQSIQNNFLPKGVLPAESGLEMAARYYPTAECAGDWYNYCFEKELGESVIAIADVSGHGAGAAMFTAIIAAIFEDSKSVSPFPSGDFATRVNHLLNRLGGGEWLASLCVVKYRPGSGQIEVLNAGHPPPLVTLEQGFVHLAATSDLLGINPEITVTSHAYPFKAGARLLMYTDGLIDSRPDYKLLPERHLLRACRARAKGSAGELAEGVYQEWLKYLHGEKALDDLCLVAARAI